MDITIVLTDLEVQAMRADFTTREPIYDANKQIIGMRETVPDDKELAARVVQAFRHSLVDAVLTRQAEYQQAARLVKLKALSDTDIAAVDSILDKAKPEKPTGVKVTPPS